MNSKYPIYVPSKNRFESRLTVKVFEKMKVPYYLVIEPQEYDKYANIVDKSKILILPWSKPESSTELVKTRNWIKKHAISLDTKRHWQIDDNIRSFMRLNNNTKIRVSSGTIFRIAEDFVDRYENIAISGLNYQWFAKQRQCIPPFYLNHRVYSCSLILNEIPYEWRGIYNDDTDICIRVLKGGWCTILFNAFLCDKMTTMVIKGGNTDIYQDDGRLKMAKSLQKQHPDIVDITWKFGKWQHSVNYAPFKKNRLIKRQDINTPGGINEYGMKLVKINNDESDLEKEFENI